MNNKDSGIKYDTGKPPWHLLAWDAVKQVVSVLDFGQNKYAPRNWELGMDYSRLFSAAIRHMTVWWDGEEYDKETGINHLAHAMCCIMFLLAYRIRGAGTDDRPKPTLLVVGRDSASHDSASHDFEKGR